MTVSYLIEMLTKLNPKTEITVWINGDNYDCEEEFDFEGDYVGSENDGYSLEVKPQAESEDRWQRDSTDVKEGLCVQG